MKAAAITAITLTAFAVFIDRQGGNADWIVTGTLIAVFSFGIGYFFRSVK
jgi:hypothetical protein